jgi:CBS domain-containing protein
MLPALARVRGTGAHATSLKQRARFQPQNLSACPPRQAAAEALAILAQRDVNQLPALDGDKLVGLLRREDVPKWLSLHEPIERR